MIINKIYTFFLIFAFGIFYSGAVDHAIAPSTDILNVVHKRIDPKQIACLAKNIYHEAGNETLQGQAAVARVVINRIKYGFAKNPCEVVYQAQHVEKTDRLGNTVKVKLCQFSWVCDDVTVRNQTRYKVAEQVAYDVLVHDKYTEVVPKNALFFHSINIDPMWPYKQVAKIGNHIFYSKQKS